MSALDRPVRVQELFVPGVSEATVAPSEVFAAFDDEQREALVQAIIPVYAKQERLSPTGGRVYEAARAVVDAICGEQS